MDFGMDVSKFPKGYKEYLKGCWKNYRHMYSTDEKWYKDMEEGYRIGREYGLYSRRNGMLSSTIGYYLSERYAILACKKMYPSIDLDHGRLYIKEIPNTSWTLDKRHLEKYFDKYRELDKFEETLK